MHACSYNERHFHRFQILMICPTAPTYTQFRPSKKGSVSQSSIVSQSLILNRERKLSSDSIYSAILNLVSLATPISFLEIEMFHLTSLSRDTSLAPPRLVYSFALKQYRNSKQFVLAPLTSGVACWTKNMSLH